MGLITYPAGQKSLLEPKETEIAIKLIKHFF
jgi:hypothetical protein